MKNVMTFSNVKEEFCTSHDALKLVSKSENSGYDEVECSSSMPCAKILFR